MGKLPKSSKNTTILFLSTPLFCSSFIYDICKLNCFESEFYQVTTMQVLQINQRHKKRRFIENKLTDCDEPRCNNICNTKSKVPPQVKI